MLNLEKSFTSFAHLASQGKTLEAMQQYYADNYAQFENFGEPVSGKAFWLAHETKNLAQVNSVTLEYNNLVFDEVNGKVWGELINKFDSKKHGPMILKEAFFQQWDKDKIILQKFYYNKIEPDKS